MQIPIVKHPFSKIGKKIESAVRKASLEFLLLDEDKVAVALSGGKDSLTLLYMLKALSGRGFRKFQIFAIFVESEFSCGAGVSKTYLKEICDSLDVKFISLNFSKKDLWKTKKFDCYICSRIRRKLIFEKAKELNIKTIAFGHHRDDANQTLIMNLLHKAEFSTILPKLEMKKYFITIIRPLIFIEEIDIISFAKNYGFLRSVCQCPHGSTSMRAKSEEIISDLEKNFQNSRKNLFKASLLYGSKKAQEKIF